MKGEWVYQVRVTAGEAIEDVVAALARAVWTALRQVQEFRGPDASRWADLHGDFSKAFARRLRFDPGCGARPECRHSTGVYGGRPDGRVPSGPTFILLLNGGLLRFVEGLSALACRRARRGKRRSAALGRMCRERLQGILHRALAPYLYFNASCSRCSIPQAATKAPAAERAAIPWSPPAAPAPGARSTAARRPERRSA